MEALRDILESCYNGNWTEAIKEFKELDLSNNEYERHLEELSHEELINLATLGYYARGE